MEGIADYTFIRSLGKGNHGEFFLARRPARVPVDVEYVAVKVIGSTGQEAFRRATRELQLFAAIRSPYLVSLYDAGQQGGVFYYAMEYLSGGSLAAPAEPPGRREVFMALAHGARAVQALHDAGIVHRDVRPGNVLLTNATDGPAAKLSDLGLAHVLSPGVTITGVGGVGSVEFMDAEFLKGERPKPWQDVWSLGATLHWTMAGVGLWGELPPRDPVYVMRKMNSTKPVVAGTLGLDVAEIVNACISEPAAARPSAGSVADRLESLALSA